MYCKNKILIEDKPNQTVFEMQQRLDDSFKLFWANLAQKKLYISQLTMNDDASACFFKWRWFIVLKTRNIKKSLS